MKRLRSLLNRDKSSGPKAQGQPPQQPLQNNPILPDTSPPIEPVEPPPQAVSGQPANQPVVGIEVILGTLNIALRNDTTSSTVYAFITGRALDRNNDLFLLQADARTPYYPSSPSNIQQPLQANCAIALGAPGNTVVAQIPHIAGGRIWFSINQPLVFKLNPGPALVEPSVTNPTDANANLDWTFAEFTFNTDQLYANISYVDFVSIPISLTLDTVNSGTRRALGLPPNGINQIADGLRTQNALDNQGWDQLIVNRPGTNTPLRILSPNQAQVQNPGLLSNYFEPYIDHVFAKYTTEPLTVDTQSAYGTLSSTPGSPTSLTIGPETFSHPSTHDIFTCSTGPFATGTNIQRNAIIPRLAAAFNRSTLLQSNSIPASNSLYYQDPITNHYSRIVHAANLDGKGYAFPYDDVQRSGEPDQSGEVNAGDPVLFTVAVGGRAAG